MIRQRSTMILILLLAVARFFYFGESCLAINYIIISEMQITGGAGKTKNDFIELYNPTDVSINLKGYRLVKRTKTGVSDTNIKSWTSDVYIPANGYYLWANNNYTDISAIPDVTTAETISPDNGIALRFGAENTGIIIDSVGWGEAQNIFVEKVAFPIINQNIYKSIQRKFQNNTFVDTNNNNADFFIQKNPNPQNSSVVAVSPQPPADQPTNTQESAPTPTTGGDVSQTANKLGDIVINEFVSDPADEEMEWIELHNTTEKEIDLDGWTIEEGSGAKTNLAGIIAASGDGKFMVIEKPKGNLNNNGDIIILRDEKKNLIDQAAYGDWNDGDLKNNAPTADDPLSVARKFDGHNSFNNAEDFAITTVPTKGKSNVIKNIAGNNEENNQNEKNNYDYSDDVVITEIFPNPAGSDNENEFIELYNGSDKDVDLTGWMIGDDSKKKYEIPNTQDVIIKAKKYLTIYRSESKIALNNGGDSVKLYQP
ncbi:lamin tail domain-containing protein, partial [Patescibacteria group bacterium]|nr:lamin tail domain-containing protein [Patescibacteria group bacterium]